LQPTANTAISIVIAAIVTPEETVQTGPSCSGVLVFICNLVTGRNSFGIFWWQWLTGNPILTFNPPTQINKLATFGTERTERVIFPLD